MDISHYNYDFNFPVVKKERKLFFRVLRIVYITSIILTFTQVIFFFHTTSDYLAVRILLATPMLIFLLTTILNLFYSNLFRNFDLIGNIFITKSTMRISIGNIITDYPLSDIRNIRISFYGSEGGEYPGNPNSMVYKEGTGNFLQFEELNGTTHQYEFFVEKEGKLRQAILTMENRHIPFKLVNKG